MDVLFVAAIVFGISSLLLLGTYVKVLVPLALLLILTAPLVALVGGSVRAAQAGNVVPFDYLESLGGIRAVIIIGFCGLYLFGYALLWLIAQFKTLPQRPKVIIPWLTLHVCAVLLFVVLALLHGSHGGPPDHQAGPDDGPDRNADGSSVDRHLADLDDKNFVRRREAAAALAKTVPNERRRQVFDKLSSKVHDHDPFMQEAVLQALAVWATEDDEPFFIDLLKGEGLENNGLRTSTLKVVGKFKDERMAQAVAACLPDFFCGEKAAAALKQKGPVDEPAVLQLLPQTEHFARQRIIDVLQDIGTPASIPKLRTMDTEGNVFQRKKIDAAVAKIRARAGG